MRERCQGYLANLTCQESWGNFFFDIHSWSTDRSDVTIKEVPLLSLNFRELLPLRHSHVIHCPMLVVTPSFYDFVRRSTIHTSYVCSSNLLVCWSDYVEKSGVWKPSSKCHHRRPIHSSMWRIISAPAVVCSGSNWSWSSPTCTSMAELYEFVINQRSEQQMHTPQNYIDFSPDTLCSSSTLCSPSCRCRSSMMAAH